MLRVLGSGRRDGGVKELVMQRVKVVVVGV